MTAAHIDRSVVEVVEDFYGDELSLALLRRIEGTPIEQLAELASRIIHQFGRNWRGEDSWWDRQTDEAGANDPRAPRPSICASEKILEASHQDHLAPQAAELKYLVLYSECVAIPEAVSGWAQGTVDFENNIEVATGDSRFLADALRALMPILPLIRSGAVVPFPASRHYYGPSYSSSENVQLDSHHASDGFYAGNESIYRVDPLLAWVAVTQLGIFSEWELEGLDLTDPEVLFDRVVVAMKDLRMDESQRIHIKTLRALRRILQQHVSATDVSRAVGLALMQRVTGIVPMTTSEPVLGFLNASSAVAMNGGADLELARTSMKAAKYGIPSISDVSWPDLIRLRSGEDTFHELREGLTRVVHRASEVSRTGFYSREVQEIAAEELGPLYRKLNSRFQRRKLESAIASYGVGGAVSMGIGGLATAVGEPVGTLGRGVAGFAGNATRGAVGKAVMQRSGDTAVARSILLSLLPVDVVDDSVDFDRPS